MLDIQVGLQTGKTWLSFGKERFGPFFFVGRLAELTEQLSFPSKPFSQRAVETGPDGTKSGLDRDPAFGRDHTSQELSLLQDVAGRNDTIDEAKLKCFFGGHTLASQDQLGRFGRPDDARESLGSPEARNESELKLGQAKLDPSGSDAHVAGHRQLQAASKAGPIDCGDHGLIEALYTVQDGLTSRGELSALVRGTELG